MNKSVKRISCLLLAAATALPLVGCKDKSSKNDTETRPVVFATEALDGNFNPFFATSASDSEMASMTQLGMLTTDKNGNIISGENEPTVVLHHEVKEREEGGKQYTDYEFVIKNGIKFSDGTDLTIKDVLFNLYVYLDQSYMGSATMYSTDIVGLKKYRTQDPDIVDESTFDESETKKLFEAAGAARQLDLIYYLDGKDDTNPTRAEEEILKDIKTLKELFWEEVNSDWTMNQGQLEGYKDEYTFTEDWQVYYYNEGLITIQYNSTTGKPLREKSTEVDQDGNPKPGKYVTNITPTGVLLDDGTSYTGTPNEELINNIKAAQNDAAAIKAYTDKGASAEDAKIFVTRDFAVKTVYDAYTDGDIKSQLLKIATMWASGTNLLDKFVAEARTAYYEDKKKEDGSLLVPTISGIRAEKKDYEGESHYVLKITINGIDPKAIYNFAFAVAPMHYYSGKFTNDKNVTKDYVKAAMDEMKNKEPEQWTEFGVAFNNNTFFDKILQADAKNAKPVGAGAYQVSNNKGQVGDSVDGDDFYSNNWVYFARNDHFKTVGDKIENAKIKYLHYKVVNSDKILQALEAGDIDVGEPNATVDNIKKLADLSDYLNQRTVLTNGYGYVGINPMYVPDINVRRVMMSAMDTINCLNYYSSEYAQLLYRSMSKASWVWTEIDHPEEPRYALQDWTLEEVKEMLGSDWVYGSDKLFRHKETGEKLKYTFTIAGATTDHPAYTMFSEAAEFLNSVGFEITVTTDISALKKLATGQLAVWAAAWSSTVDPDMYQVYHKDSTATSTKNWGYGTIFDDTEKFSYEVGIINRLSDLIEQGRETNVQADRAEIYGEALDLVMDLAVEMPTYQRYDCVAYNKKVIDPASLNGDPTPFAGVIDKVWELDYV